MKKRSSKEIIEQSDPRLEHGYIKFPGQELIDVTLDGREGEVDFDIEKIEKLYDKHKKSYTELHTHPTGDSIPSGQDIRVFLNDNNARTMVVASQNPKDGKVEGYFFLRKRKKDSHANAELKRKENEDIRRLKEIEESYENMYRNHKIRMDKRNNSWYIQALKKVGIDLTLKPLHERTERDRNWDTLSLNIPKEEKEQMKDEIEFYQRHMIAHRLNPGLDRLATRYNLQYRFVPANGYSLQDYRFKKKLSGLEKTSGIVSILSSIGGLFFLSSNITGNVISSLNTSTSNIIGAVLLLIGLVGAFFWFKNR